MGERPAAGRNCRSDGAADARRGDCAGRAARAYGTPRRARYPAALAATPADAPYRSARPANPAALVGRCARHAGPALLAVRRGARVRVPAVKARQYNPADYVRACCGVQINAPHTPACLREIRQRHPCGWPPVHDEEQVDAGVAGPESWARGERMYKLRCRRCGGTRGPFITDSGDAGF
jgi:hypothetical protein